MQTPLCWGFTLGNTNMLVSKKVWTQCEFQSTQCDRQHKQVEYSFHWAISCLHCVGHVDFMLFVSCLLVLGSQHKHVFWWNMDLNCHGCYIEVLFCEVFVKDKYF